MFVGKRVSVLAIDGNYIHLMPPEHKGMFDSVKTVSKSHHLWLALISFFS
jgi:hypothetical protein